jgi:hypothetical protein
MNAAVIVAALGIGTWLLVQQGQLDWPPSRLLENLSTLAGCLALVGPILLLRQDRSKAGVGDLVWLTAGCLTWLYNLAALARGSFVLERAPNPSGALIMGLAIGAVSIAGLRLQGLGRAWTWTNITGWVLGIFWIVLGTLTLLPDSSPLGLR